MSKQPRRISMDLTSDEAYLIQSIRNDNMLKKAIFGYLEEWKEEDKTEKMVSSYAESYD